MRHHSVKFSVYENIRQAPMISSHSLHRFILAFFLQNLQITKLNPSALDNRIHGQNKLKQFMHVHFQVG